MPVIRRLNGTVTVKETMAITMTDPVEVADKPFRNSRLFMKLQRMIVVARVFESRDERRSICRQITEFDLADRNLHDRIEADCNQVREVIRTTGFDAPSGSMGVLVQPRTKEPGHGSRSRAFYARKQLVEKIPGIQQ